MIDVHHIEQISQDCSLTEFVGTTVLDTIGLVIPGIDPSLLEKMNLKKPYKSLAAQFKDRCSRTDQQATKLSSHEHGDVSMSFLVIQKAGADTDVSS